MKHVITWLNSEQSASKGMRFFIFICGAIIAYIMCTILNPQPSNTYYDTVYSFTEKLWSTMHK